MDKNSPGKDALSENLAGIGPVSRERVHVRALELAWIAGRVPPHVSQADYEQAERELADESGLDRQDALFDSVPESRRWDPVPGSTGRQVPDAPSEDEDDEGRNESAQLVEEGASEAGRDHMLQATRAAENPDRDEP